MYKGSSYILFWTVIYDDILVLDWSIKKIEKMFLFAAFLMFLHVSIPLSSTESLYAITYTVIQLTTWINRVHHIVLKKLKYGDNDWHSCFAALMVWLCSSNTMLSNWTEWKAKTKYFKQRPSVGAREYLTHPGYEKHFPSRDFFKSSIIQSLEGIEPPSALTSRRPQL